MSVFSVSNVARVWNVNRGYKYCTPTIRAASSLVQYELARHTRRRTFVRSVIISYFWQWLRRVVLKRCRKIVSDGDEVRCAGRLFHRLAAKTGKARLPTVYCIAAAVSLLQVPLHSLFTPLPNYTVWWQRLVCVEQLAQGRYLTAQWPDRFVFCIFFS